MSQNSQQVKNRALKLLTAKDRTVHELRVRLGGEYDSESVEEALTYLQERGYVDDLRYARNFVDHRNRLRPTGNTGLAMELQAKGIPEHIIAQALNPPELEQELAKRVLEQRLPSYRGLDRERLLRRAYGLLERRGFTWPAARSAVAQVLDSDLQKD